MPRSAALFENPDTLALDWKGLYQEHAPRLRRIAERRVGSEHAEDVVQDTFMRAFRNRDSLDPERPIGAWLSAITLCSSTDALRRRSARPEVPVTQEQEPSTGWSLEDEFENAVRRMGIEAAFDSLNLRQRRVLQRIEVDGWTNEQVAAVEHMSTDAVKSVAARARRTFRRTYSAFAEHMGVFGGAAVGPALLKLRARVQRWQGLAGEHVGAFGVAVATVTVVAIAAVPSTRPLPTSAVEQAPGAADAGSDPAEAEAGRMTFTESPLTPSATVTTTTDDSKPEVTAEGTASSGGTVQVQATTSAGREGTGASAGLALTESAGDANKRTYAGVTVTDCDANLGTRAECAAIDLVSQEP